MNLIELLIAYQNILATEDLESGRRFLLDTVASTAVIDSIMGSFDSDGNPLTTYNNKVVLGSQLKAGQRIRSLQWAKCDIHNECYVRATNSEYRSDVHIEDTTREAFFFINKFMEYEILE